MAEAREVEFRFHQSEMADLLWSQSPLADISRGAFFDGGSIVEIYGIDKDTEFRVTFREVTPKDMED